MTTRCYLSSDASAPVLAPNTPGSLLAVVRACLVGTGGIAYGSKPSVGLTEAFTGTNAAAFLTSTSGGGTGCYLLVDDTSVGNYRLAAVTAYSSMSAINTGSNPTDTRYIARAPANHTTNAVSWCLWANTHGFYFSTQQNGSGSTVLSSFGGGGDATSYTALDAYRYFAIGETSSVGQPVGNPMRTSGNFGGLGSGGSAAALSLGRDYTGTGSASPHGLVAACAGTSTPFVGDNTWPPSPSLNGAGDAVMEAIIARERTLRGKLPGIYIPVFDATALSVGQAYSGTIPGLPVGNVLRAAHSGVLNTGAAGGFLIESALEWS